MISIILKIILYIFLINIKKKNFHIKLFELDTKFY